MNLGELAIIKVDCEGLIRISRDFEKAKTSNIDVGMRMAFPTEFANLLIFL